MPIITNNSNERLLPYRTNKVDLPFLDIMSGKMFKVTDKRQGANSKILFKGLYSAEKGFQDQPVWFLDHTVLTEANKGWERLLKMLTSNGFKDGSWQYMPDYRDIDLPDIERKDYYYYPLWVLQVFKQEGLFEKAMRSTALGSTPDDEKMIVDSEELDTFYYHLELRAKKEMDFLAEFGINEPLYDTAKLHELRLKKQEESKRIQLDIQEKEKLDQYLDQALALRSGNKTAKSVEDPDNAGQSDDSDNSNDSSDLHNLNSNISGETLIEDDDDIDSLIDQYSE